MIFQRLERQKAHILLLDLQEKLIPAVEGSPQLIHKLQKLLQGARLMKIPITFTEQYPQGLGSTIPEISSLLDGTAKKIVKTSFSAAEFLEAGFQWIVAGIETHVCLRQTVLDLRRLHQSVTVLADATASRKAQDAETALAEMRSCGVQVTSTEALLFEWIGNAKDPLFKDFSTLIR